MALKHKHMRAFFMTNTLLLSTAYLQHLSYLSPSLCGPLDLFFLPIKLKNFNKIQFQWKLRTKKKLIHKHEDSLLLSHSLMHYIVTPPPLIVLCSRNWGLMPVRDKLESFRIPNVISFITARWTVFSLAGFIVNHPFNR